MYPVSEEYKSQRNKNTRNASDIRITIGVENPDTVSVSDIYSNNERVYSNTNQIDISGKEVTHRYGVMNLNGIILDGNTYPYDPNNPKYQGYVSGTSSSVTTKSYSDVYLEITFETPTALRGIQMVFDEIYDNYPTEFEIYTSYQDGNVHWIPFENDSTTFTSESNIPSSGVMDYMGIMFYKSNRGARELRVTNIVFGIEKIFTSLDLLSANYKRRVDPMNSKLPTISLDFSIIDADKKYSPDRPGGIWAYLDKGQEVRSELGYELDSGEIEWVDMGKLVSSGEVKVSKSSGIQTAQFSSISLLNSLDGDYLRGKYYDQYTDLYTIATELMESLNLPLNKDGTKKWEFDSALMSQFYTQTPLPIAPVNQCLQILASASCGTLSVNRKGNITITKPDLILDSDFKFDFSNIYAEPEIKKYPQLRSVIVDYTIPAINLENTELYEENNVSAETATEFVFYYDLSKSQNLVLTGSLEVVGDVFYGANCTIVTLLGSGNVYITGNLLTEIKRQYVHNVNPTGADCPVESLLISQKSHAQQYAEFISTFASMQNEYSVSDRGYPELDALDTVLADTGFSENVSVIVTDTDIRFEEGLSGTTKYFMYEQE